MKVYIAGPYTQGDVNKNVRNAITAGQKILEAGHTPFIPHLCHFWDLIYPGSWEQWMALDKEWVAVCDALIWLPGPSVGADTEARYAESLGIPVYLGVEQFLLRQGTAGAHTKDSRKWGTYRILVRDKETGKIHQPFEPEKGEGGGVSELAKCGCVDVPRCKFLRKRPTTGG